MLHSEQFSFYSQCFHCIGEEAWWNCGQNQTQNGRHFMRTLWEQLFFLRDGYIEVGYYMSTKDKKHPGIRWFSNKASHCFGCMGNCLDHLQQFNRITRESYLADLYLQSIGFKSTEQVWVFLSKAKSSKHAGTLLNSHKTNHAILKKHWKSICEASYWKNKVNVSHLYHVKVGTVSKTIFSKALIKSHYLASLGQWIHHYEWRLMPVDMNVSISSNAIFLQPNLLQLQNCQQHQWKKQ